MRFKIRNDIKPLYIQENGCTPHITIHPVTHYMFSLRECDGHGQYGEHQVSFVSFSKRQKWDCYYYDLGEHGWCCERDNVYLRLSEEDFIRIFGKVIIINTYGSSDNRSHYHEECDASFTEGVNYI